MGKLKLAVAGRATYMDRLADYIQKNGPEYVEISRHSGSDGLENFLENVQPDILLYSRDNISQTETLEHTVKILLTDTREPDTDLKPSVFRFQSGEEILRQVFGIYGRLSGRNLTCWYLAEKLQMYAVYAPGGHELQLPFSVTCASLWGRKGKTLYLNLSEYSGMVSLLGDQEGETISDLIYGIRQNKEKFQIYLQSVLHHTEYFDYIHPPVNPKDLYEIREEDLMNLLSLLTEQSEYQYVIWNAGSFSQLTESLLRYCQHIFCVVKENSFGKYRKTELEHFLEKESAKGIREKICYVSPQNGNGGVLCKGADILTQLHSGEFAGQVRMLIREKIEEIN